ncbi:DUF1697 domain-containing protein [Micromonospora sp. WMMD1102]|uniref:DUF1697 domain-containing protein n=1 Tax=Micromonospora sp. WMMD1102 TaxID=3016105 RepID=UPI0024150DDC|nr:DUF1697 domain-containing protein [Micromonospora sp. WMMD1102]MDG4790987.1 DUF1697 domain-containing protein [Micromonospora sp. WMMD1102]
MVRYAALLRGVNLGSHNRIGMADLRRIVTELGHDEVRTYLQSGNVVFGAADDADPGRLADGIRRALADQSTLDVAVMVRSGPELAKLTGGNPYASGQPDEVKLLVAFLAEPPESDRVAGLAVPGGETAEFRFADTGRDVYLHFPDGYGRSRFNLEKRLGVASTTRNWKTVRALAELTTVD